MRRRIVALTALALSCARRPPATDEAALTRAAVQARDALARAEGCLLGAGDRPATQALLVARVRRVALGPAGVEWPMRCVSSLAPLEALERGLTVAPPAVSAIAREAQALRDALGSSTTREDARLFREGEADFRGAWLSSLGALRDAVQGFARLRGSSLLAPSREGASAPLPSLAVESLPLSLAAGARLVGTRSAGGVFVAAWIDGDGARVVCRSGDLGVSMRCRRGGEDAAVDAVSGEGRSASWNGRRIEARVRDGRLRVRDGDGAWRALTDVRAHGGIDVREAWVLSMGERLLVVAAGEGVSMFVSADGGRRWSATREGI